MAAVGALGNDEPWRGQRKEGKNHLLGVLGTNRRGKWKKVDEK